MQRIMVLAITTEVKALWHICSCPGGRQKKTNDKILSCYDLDGEYCIDIPSDMSVCARLPNTV